jgi:leader peptidase (prepilin peptidase) / N-methyltransferase
LSPLLLIGAPLAGAVVGSFIATVLIRWPNGRSAVSGRSRCDHCGIKLEARELIPLLSFALQGGRCRQCRSKIDRRHLAIELAAAALGLVVVLVHPLPLALISALFGFWLLLLAALDLEHQWLPDALTLPLIPLGWLAALLGFGPDLLWRLAGAVIGWTILAAIAWLYRLIRHRDGMGGGDPKLLAAIGAWVGALQLPYILLGAGLLGLAAVTLMRLRGEPVEATSRLPLGTLIALAAWPCWLVIAA